MKSLTWKLFLSLTMALLFVAAAQVETFAQRGGGQRPPNAQRGQRPPEAQQGQRPNRENSPYADKWKNGQRRPEGARGNGRPQGTFPRN
ncbi:MAG: hypothetical protein JNJ50_29070 [Acidobacteria bacterium]|nr:hypothetical protein [Acidobacteriota bacterium]